MHSIFVANQSNHPQEFEIHGWNNNKNLTVQPNQTATIEAADHSSGAIIALHDGHEGEQAEITKDGFGGNDFIDLSNIVGAGGNMTVQQSGLPHTRKGDPKFMQDLNQAWHKTNQGTRDSLKDCVHTNKEGNVIRIDAIKDHPKLEAFVRSFADGKTYIGVGAWGGSPGNGSDNGQSSGGQGDRDIQVTYSDDDATPRGPPHLAHRPLEAMVVQTHAAPNQPEPKPSGPGIILKNRSTKKQDYFFYDNFWNGNGVAGANFDHPLKSVVLQPGTAAFVDLPESFKGRVQRGKILPATWVEFQVKAANDGGAHGDISLEQGCDGAATIAATDGSGRKNGFENNILQGAPEGALYKRSDEEKVLASTMGNWMAGPNAAAVKWENEKVGQKKAYIQGGTGTDDVASKNKCLAVDMF